MVTPRPNLACGGSPFCLLQVKQNATGALNWDAIGGEGVNDLGERELYVVERFHARESGAKDVGAADHASGELAAFVIALVEVTEFLATKCGRAAKNAIFLKMVTDTKRAYILQVQQADHDKRAAKGINGSPHVNRVTDVKGGCR